MVVAGIDRSRPGWVAVVLENGRFLRATLGRGFDDLMPTLADCSCVTVDIPIGLPENGPRRADIQAREWVGLRRSSIFATPPLAAIEAADYPAALASARGAGFGGISRQAHGLRRQILEVGALASRDGRIHEAHPEVSFRAMHGEPLVLPKRTWGGFTLRRRLLADQGIEIPDELPDAERSGIDDVVDAAAAAWTAQRIAAGGARSFPADGAPGRAHRIWY